MLKARCARVRESVICGLLALCLSTSLWARKESWTDLDGNEFKGEPVGLLGPFALFKTGNTTGRHVLLSRLSPEDCTRVAAAISDAPERAASWADAKSRLTNDFPGVVGHLQDGEIVPEDLGDRPEPEIILVLFGSHSVGRSWGMLGDARESYQELKNAYPDDFEAVYIGLGHNEQDHLKLAKDMNIPYLLSEYSRQKSMRTLGLFTPGKATWMVALTREGIPLVVDAGEDTAAVQDMVGKIGTYLQAIQTDNPSSWPHLRYYHHNVRMAQHQADQVAPMAVGSALKSSALPEYGITAFDATLEVNAEGIVTKATIKPGPGIPENLIPSVEKALMATPVVPAIDHGTPVAGTLEWRYP